MKEKAFNLFVFVEREYIRGLGAKAHEVNGPDAEKLAFLRSVANSDAAEATRYDVPSRYTFRQEDGTYLPGLSYCIFKQMTGGGLVCEVFDEILEELGATQTPLVVVTPVVDGEVRVDQVGEIPFLPPPSEPFKFERYPAPDYVLKYLTKEGFDLPHLLNDDHLRAIKLLYQQRLFVSAAKLLMSFVDTIAYLHAGDAQGNFQHWLNSFVDMQSVSVTADELWEFRNSLLHMTTTDSRKVIAGKVRRLSFYVGTLPRGLAPDDGDVKFFDLHGLIHATADGLERWISEFNRQPSKTAEFFQRYDRILSDVRYEFLSHSPAESELGGVRDAPDLGTRH